MRTFTLKIRKRNLFIFIFLIIIAVTGFMLINTYSEMLDSGPRILDDYDDIELIQLLPSADNAKKAVISTSAGDITAVLYEDEVPQAAELFTECAQSGLYNSVKLSLYEGGAIFSMDISPLDTPYNPEFHKNLWPFKGALCMTEEGDVVFINTTSLTDEEKEYLADDDEPLPEVRHAYLDVGGVPNFSGVYAVFGQVTEGMDVLESIAAAPVDSEITVINVSIS